jgi:hypothetical protein
MTTGAIRTDALPARLRGETAVAPADRRLRAIAISAGLIWSALFVIVGVRNQLQAYGDGSMFSYAVAVQDGWAFHWHNISTRLFVYLYSLLPAETYVRITGDARGGVAIYGFLFFLAPLLGLAATWIADRSNGRIVFGYACASTACLCPLVFGFPTEMWMAHTLFWPALALCHYGGRGRALMVARCAVFTAMVLTHGGAVVFAAVILFTVALRGARDGALLRAAIAVCVAMAIWTAVRITWRPDSYFASVLPAAALNFIDIGLLANRVCLMLVAALAIYGLAFAALLRLSPGRAHFYAAAIAASALAAYWICSAHTVLAENRYYLRTALLYFTPAFAVAAVGHALYADGRLALPTALQSLMTARAGSIAAQAIAGALMVTMLVHAVETEKFVVAWTAYKAAVARLVSGRASDPQLGDPRFVSASRIAPGLRALAWSSTTQYLSVLMAPNFKPKQIVVDPAADYFWLSCETATANRMARRAVPAQSRELISIHACLHRKRLFAASAPAAKKTARR